MATRMDGMSNPQRIAGRFVTNEDGATAIEYALIASGIGAAIVSIVFGVGNTITNDLYAKIAALL
jgi:Flp pilus assembly pilin Flp